MEEQRYEIGGDIYIQRPLTLAQIKELIALLKDFNIPLSSGPVGIIDALGEKVPVALALILEEQPHFFPRLTAFIRKWSGKNTLTARAGKLEGSITLDQTLEVIDHFFALNPIASLLKRFESMTAQIGVAMTMK
jgi:hypothetical protein